MTTPTDDALPQEVADFLRDALPGGFRVAPLHGDASIRRYYRVHAGDMTLILAYYPETVRESLNRFLRAHSALTEKGRVPAVLRHSDAVLLQQDVGDDTLYDLLRRDREAAVPLYREAISLLVNFQQAGLESGGINPPFDRRKFRDELEMTAEFYVSKLCGEKPSENLGVIFDDIASDLASHPYVLCHRDYHGQNIHVVDGDLFVIDFQDLRLGPDTYDLASLLRDRGAGDLLGDPLELELIDDYRRRIGADAALRSRYFRNLLQRAVKAIGTFAKQAVTRDRLHYLDFIPPTLTAVERALQEVPEYAPLRRHFPMRYDASRTRKGEMQ